jgi:hypothetical protein
MELNRNHFLAIGVIMLLLGLQFRFVESYLLTKETSRFIQKRIDRRKRTTSISPFSGLLSIPTPPMRLTIRPPRWLGWSLISAGAIMMLHSLAMRKPD